MNIAPLIPAAAISSVLGRMSMDVEIEHRTLLMRDPGGKKAGNRAGLVVDEDRVRRLPISIHAESE